MKRMLLFLATNHAVVLVLSIVMNVLGVGRFPMAKWATGARVIDSPRDSTEQWLVGTIRELARRARSRMPEVAIFEGAPNAFATGAFKNSARVAVSTGLLQSMNRQEVVAVLAHEISHVSNGDMVTLTLIQGVVNTFVIFLARVVGYFVDETLLRSECGVGPGFFQHATSTFRQGVLGRGSVSGFL
jgi:heat shock protein HtpX